MIAVMMALPIASAGPFLPLEAPWQNFYYQLRLKHSANKLALGGKLGKAGALWKR